MNARDLNQTVEIIPLLGYDLKKAGGYHVGACPFCGGTDRFTVKHTKDGDRWHCRQCGDGKYHTPIDLYMGLHDADFKTALKELGGDLSAARPLAVARSAPKPKPITLPAAEWQAEAWRIVDAAHDALMESPQGQAARDFLTSRGLHLGTWEAWKLGYMEYSPEDKPHVKIPVITIPWWESGGKESDVITAVKYRVLRKNSSLRYFSMKGSMFDIPFGLQGAFPVGVFGDAIFEQLPPAFHDTLLFIEGEFNALSVWQCNPAGLSVLSFGAEGSGDIRILRALAEKYQHVFVWADDIWDNPKQASRAKELRALVRGRGVPLRSAKDDHGIKQDANQLLQNGTLRAFLYHVLKVECE